jgi:hypothetical protein
LTAKLGLHNTPGSAYQTPSAAATCRKTISIAGRPSIGRIGPTTTIFHTTTASTTQGIVIGIAIDDKHSTAKTATATAGP